MCKYHFNFQNCLTLLKCNFVTHNLPKISIRVRKSNSRPKMATKRISATNFLTYFQTNQKSFENVFKYHLNFQNDITMLKCKFVTYNLPKSSKVRKKHFKTYNANQVLYKCDKRSFKPTKEMFKTCISFQNDQEMLKCNL